MKNEYAYLNEKEKPGYPTSKKATILAIMVLLASSATVDWASALSEPMFVTASFSVGLAILAILLVDSENLE